MKIKRYMAMLIATACLAASCAISGTPDKKEKHAGIEVYVIEDGRVTCYWKKVVNAGGLSCLPTQQTKENTQ